MGPGCVHGLGCHLGSGWLCGYFLLQAAQLSSWHCAYSIPSQSPAGCILTSFWPSWPWNWSVPWRVCSSTQVRTTTRPFLQRPACSPVHLRTRKLFSKLFYVAENLLSVPISHCWHSDFSHSKSTGRYQWASFLVVCHPQVSVNWSEAFPV